MSNRAHHGSRPDPDRFPAVDEVTVRLLAEVLERSHECATLVVKYPHLPRFQERLVASLDDLTDLLASFGVTRTFEKNGANHHYDAIAKNPPAALDQGQESAILAE